MVRTSSTLVAAALSFALAQCGGQSSVKNDSHGSHATGGSDPSGGTAGTGANASGGTAGTASGGTGGGEISGRDYAHRFAENYCQSIEGCCNRQFVAVDVAMCTMTLERIIGPTYEQALLRPNVVFDPEAAERCLEAYRVALTACGNRRLALEIDSACEGVVHGTLPEGAACDGDEECAQTANGIATLCDEDGVCRRVTDEPGSVFRAGIMEPCGMSCMGALTWETCTAADPNTTLLGICYSDDGLYCSEAAVCEPSPGVGEPCPTLACARGAYCVDGTCVAGTETGFCEVGYECLTSSHCDFETHDCVPSFKNGDDCTDSVQCESEFCSGNHCGEWSLAKPETCAGIEIAGAY